MLEQLKEYRDQQSVADLRTVMTAQLLLLSVYILILLQSYSINFNDMTCQYDIIRSKAVSTAFYLDGKGGLQYGRAGQSLTQLHLNSNHRRVYVCVAGSEVQRISTSL